MLCDMRLPMLTLSTVSIAASTIPARDPAQQGSWCSIVARGLAPDLGLIVLSSSPDPPRLVSLPWSCVVKVVSSKSRPCLLLAVSLCLGLGLRAWLRWACLLPPTVLSPVLYPLFMHAAPVAFIELVCCASVM